MKLVTINLRFLSELEGALLKSTISYSQMTFFSSEKLAWYSYYHELHPSPFFQISGEKANASKIMLYFSHNTSTDIKDEFEQS